MSSESSSIGERAVLCAIECAGDVINNICELIGGGSFITVVLFLPLFIYTDNNKPECNLLTFYVPSLNKFNQITPQSTTYNTSSNIFFHLSLKNPHDTKSIRYVNDVNITFSYDTNPRYVIGSYRLNKFFQGKEKTAKVRGVVVVSSRNDTGLGLLNFGASNSTNTTAKFRIDLTTKVKFKFLFFYSNRKKLVVGRSFEVDDSGKKVGMKPLKLRSGASARYGARGVFFHLAVCLLTLTFSMLN